MDNNRKLVIAGLILLAGIMTAMLISHYSLRQENIELSRVEDLEATRQENIDHCFREAEKVGKTRWTKHCEAYDIEIEADGNCMIDDEDIISLQQCLVYNQFPCSWSVPTCCEETKKRN